MSNQDILNQFVKRHLGKAHIEFLAADMSPRAYHRVFANDKSYVLMDARESVEQFVRISNYLVERDIRSPRVLAQQDNMLLLEDFGNKTLTTVFAESTLHEKKLYEKSLDVIYKLYENQTPDKGILDYSMDLYLGEIKVFADYYYEFIHKKPMDESTSLEWTEMWRKAFESVHTLTPTTLVLRDYHVDNIMLLENEDLGVLDFQDAVFGSVTYDFISLIEDARRPLNPDLKKHLIRYFLGFFNTTIHSDILHTSDILGAGRHAKVLGVFTRYLLLHKKPDKLRHLDHVLRLLNAALKRAGLSEIQYFLKDQGL